jgi:hypothetical protein
MTFPNGLRFASHVLHFTICRPVGALIAEVACVTVNVVPAIVMVPTRCVSVVFDATL